MRRANFIERLSALAMDEVILVAFTALVIVLLKNYLNIKLTIVQLALLYEFIDYNYYTLFWRFTAKTPGKVLLHLRIAKIDGSRLTYKDVFIRYWVWMIGVTLLGYGYISISWNNKKQGWNDIAAKTYVIKELQ